MIRLNRQSMPTSAVDDLARAAQAPFPRGVMTHTWELPPEELIIEEGEIHVWRAILDGDAEDFSRQAGTLSRTELARAAKFKFEKDRRRYMMARGILRAILGRYLSLDACEVRLDTGLYGKPRLRKLEGGPDLRFSLAHSQGFALYAFVLGHEVGVDLEFIKEDVDVMRLADHVFSEKQTEALNEHSGIDRVLAFYSAWTRMEAYLKACGLGFSVDPRCVDLPILVGAPDEFVNPNSEADKDEKWTIYDLEPAPEFAGAMVVEGVDWHLVRWSRFGPS